MLHVLYRINYVNCSLQDGRSQQKACCQTDSLFLKTFFKLALQDDLVVRGTHRLLVPDSLQPKLISLAHDTHQVIVRTKQRLREAYWWPSMDTQVEAAIRACITCQSHDKSAITHITPLQPVPYPERAWEKVAIDVVGPFDKAPIDCRFAITLIDYKWQVARPNLCSTCQFMSLHYMSLLFSFYLQSSAEKGTPRSWFLSTDLNSCHRSLKHSS